MAEYDLISKTALLKQLDMAMDCKDCPRNINRKTYYDRCACTEVGDICDTITDFATFADVQPVNQWISVNDRLPENCIEVLVYDTDCGIVIGWYDKEIGDFAADFISPLDAVTHWQPLPEKPQD